MVATSRLGFQRWLNPFIRVNRKNEAVTTPTADPLLASLDWPGLDERVRAQQRNREVHTPAISTFRWWARRSHALIGELLDGAASDSEGFCVGDPFSGGGTVAVEAARRGINVFAQDLHPWAIAGLSATLKQVDCGELEKGAKKLLGALAGLRTTLYRSNCPDHGDDSEVLTAFWVRVASCPGCGNAVHLFPYSLITKASRASEESGAWWGCSACGTATKSSDKAGDRSCSGCGSALVDGDVPLNPSRQASCPHTGCTTTFAAFESPPRWKMVLVQRRCRFEGRSHVHFDLPSEGEIRRAESSDPALPVPATLNEPIPEGLETRVLRRTGFSTWADLYSPRQLQVLATAIPVIDSMRVEAAVRERLKLALCGCAEMAGRVSRWDRYYPKAFEAMANHRFAVTGLSCETNLLAERGRGTLPRRLGHTLRAAQWAKDELPTGLVVSRRQALATSGRVQPDGVVLTEGSSERQRATTGSIDLVLTDPPYFDDVQYAELAAVFLAWARASGLVPVSATLDLGSEAVANTQRGTGVERYCDLLTGILSETHRTLAGDGRMVLTYHNSDIRAWWALGRALRSAKFRVSALAITHSENERDHAKRGKLAFSRDLVIECDPLPTDDKESQPEPRLVWEAEGSEAAELVAAGRALATMPTDEELDDFRNRFCTLRGQIAPTRISPRTEAVVRHA